MMADGRGGGADAFDAVFLRDALAEMCKYRDLAERALAQLPSEHLFARTGPGQNSIALIMKHMAGNMHSRWTEFLHTDGEKPDRDRDAEFERTDEDTPESVRERWDQGWQLTLSVVETLRPGDVTRVVTIRGEPHTVAQAIQRQLTHYAYHVGQIVLLAKQFAGGDWRSLSIPIGRSRDWEVARSGRPYPVAADAAGGPYPVPEGREMHHYLLFYDVVDDYVQRRGPLREQHLELAWEAQRRGELVLGGALADPADGVVLLFRGDSPDAAEAFARADPYVAHGLVAAWRVRRWTTVVGEDAATPVRVEDLRNTG